MATKVWGAGSNNPPTGSWDADANWTGDVEPGASDLAKFDSTSTVNCDIDKSITVGGIEIASGYTGTVTQTSTYTVTIGNQNFTQVDGFFLGGSGNIDLNGNLSVTASGDFTSTSGTFYLTGGSTYPTFVMTGTFHDASGLLLVDKNDGASITFTMGSNIFNNVTCTTNVALYVVGTWDIDGDLITGANTKFYNGTITLAGDITIARTTLWLDSAHTTCKFDGSTAQTVILDSPGNTRDFGMLVEIANTNTVTFGAAGDTIKFTGGSFVYTSGTYAIAADAIIFERSGSSGFIITPGTYAWGADVSVITGGGYVSLTGTWDINADLTWNAGGPLYSGTIALSGNMTCSYAESTFAATMTGVIKFDLNGDQWVKCNSAALRNFPAALNCDKAGGTLTIGDTGHTLCMLGGVTRTNGTITHVGTLKFKSRSGSFNDSVTSYVNITIDLEAAYSFTVTGTLNISANLVITTANQIVGAILVGGDLTSTDASVAGSGTITLNGTGTQTITCSDLPDGTITINKASGYAILAANLTLNGSGQDLVITAGILDLAGFTLAVADVLSVANAATLRMQGGETVTYATLTLSSGSIQEYNGTGTYTIKDWAYKILKINGTGTFNNGATRSIERLWLVACSAYNQGNYNLTCTPASGNAITIDGGSFVGGANSITVTGDFVMNGGAFLSTSGTMQLNGTYVTMSAGTFTHNSGTVWFRSPAKIVNFGSNIFWNVEINTVNQNWDQTGTMDVNGTFTLTNVGKMTGGTITVAGSSTTTDAGVSIDSTTLIKFDGSGAQTLQVNGAGGTAQFPCIEVDKSGGSTLTINDVIEIVGTGGGLLVTNGNISHTGTIRFMGQTMTVNIGSQTLNNVRIAHAGGYSITITGTMQVNGTFDTSTGNYVVNGGTIGLGGASITGNTVGSFTGTVALIVNGAGAQTINGGAYPSGTFTINKASGEAALGGNLILIGAGQDLAVAQGVFSLAGYNLTVPDQLTVASGAELKLKGNETISYSGFTPASGSIIRYYDAAQMATMSKLATTIPAGVQLHFGASKTHVYTHGVTYTYPCDLYSDGTSSTRSVLISNSGTEQYFWTSTGTNYFDDKINVTDCDASGGNLVWAIGSIGGTQNNINWKFSIGGGRGGLRGMKPISNLG